MKLMRDEYIAMGKCPICREHAPLAEGRAMCPDCLARYRGYANGKNAAKKAMGRCVRCSQKAEPGRIMCPVCAEKTREYNRLRRAKKRAEGLCAQCSAPAAPGKTLCEYHAKKTSEKQTKWREGRKYGTV